MNPLLECDEPSIRYKIRLHLYGESPDSAAMQQLQQSIQTSQRVRRLLSERGADGMIPHHAYHKWNGAHWVLVMLAELDYPPGDSDLIPLREQVYGYLFSAQHVRSIKQKTIAGRVRMCASIEGNAIYALSKLGLADERTPELVARLLAWQWPDGGWNCDKNPLTQVSSFTESLLPLRGLAQYAQVTGDAPAAEAAARTAEVFLQRHLFRRLSNGVVMNPDFLKLHYPCYWHYDILMALKVLNEAGFIADPRCGEALDQLRSKQLSDGGFPAEGKFYRVTDEPMNRCTRVDWGGTSRKQMNPFVTADALVVLKAAGHNTVSMGL
ncbi:MAG: hypothetical protein K8L97_13125 [Anaerolineae bacterium]|nr:hypothetical protein [Anaerolineae bacterium]